MSKKRTNHKKYLSPSGVLNHRPESSWEEEHGESLEEYLHKDIKRVRKQRRETLLIVIGTHVTSAQWHPRDHSIRTITKLSPLGEAEISISPGKAIFLQGTPATETKMNEALGPAVSKQLGHQGKEGSQRKTMKWLCRDHTPGNSKATGEDFAREQWGGNTSSLAIPARKIWIPLIWFILHHRLGRSEEGCRESASAKSLQSCPTLCDPIDGSPPGLPVPGILQARTLEWVAISFSNACKWKVKVKSLSRVWPSATPWSLQPSRLLHPWDFPGKSTGVGCHCLLRCKEKWTSKEEGQHLKSGMSAARVTVTGEVQSQCLEQQQNKGLHYSCVNNIVYKYYGTNINKLDFFKQTYSEPLLFTATQR